MFSHRSRSPLSSHPDPNMSCFSHNSREVFCRIKIETMRGLIQDVPLFFLEKKFEFLPLVNWGIALLKIARFWKIFAKFLQYIQVLATFHDVIELGEYLTALGSWLHPKTWGILCPLKISGIFRVRMLFRWNTSKLTSFARGICAPLVETTFL